MPPPAPASVSGLGASAASMAGRPLEMASSTLRLSVLFQWFLMALSVRPTKVLAISAQRLPNWWCAMMSLRSSAVLHSSRLMSGFRWLYHRSRHCLPMRPASRAAHHSHFQLNSCNSQAVRQA